jgi:hypothetical protein
MANRKGKSVSSFIREILKEYISKYTDTGNDIMLMPRLDDDPYLFFQNFQVDEEKIGEIWKHAREWLSYAEYEMQKRKGGPITVKYIQIP